MTEPGGVERQSIGHAKEMLSSAREQLSQGDSNPAREAVSSAARTLSESIERGNLPRNPARAWTLERVTIRCESGFEDVTYSLRPPQETQDQRGIAMAYVRLAPGGRFDDIMVLPVSRKINPFYEYAPTYTQSFANRQSPEIYDVIATTFDDIADNGVLLREGGVLKEQPDAMSASSGMNTLLQRLPYSHGRLTRSSADALDQQYRAAESETARDRSAARHQDVPHYETARQQVESPADRAWRLGLRSERTEGRFYTDEDIADGLANGISGGYENMQFTNQDDQAYRLEKLDIKNVQGRNVIQPSYRFVPPTDSDLPTLEMDERGMRLIRGSTILEFGYGRSYHPQRAEFLNRMLDVYSHLSEHGIQTPHDFIPTFVLPDSYSDAMLATFDEEFPLSSMLSRELRDTAVERRAWEAAHPEEAQLGDFAEMLGENINGLAGYTGTSGEPVLGTLLTQPDNELLATIESASSYRTLDRVLGNGDTDEALTYARKFITEGLINLRKSTKKRLLFAPSTYNQQFSLERGHPPIEPAYSGSLRSARVEQTDEQGNIPLLVDGEFEDIKIKATAQDFHITTVQRFKKDGEFIDTLDDTPEDLEGMELGTDNKNDFRPTFEITLTEAPPPSDDASGEAHEYKVWRVDDGILMQCDASKPPIYYKRDVIANMAAAGAMLTRKPVIYLYPKNKSKIHVKLDYKGQLTNTYPQIDGNSWDVVATSDGTLIVKGKQYKYLFWDGINREVDWDWSEGFCVNRKDVDIFLEKKLARLGLNFAEAQDFITYWAPMMKQNTWSLVSFQTEKYEELAQLQIDPKPDTLIRVFMIFTKCDKQISIREQKLKRINRKGFTVVEWGGSNLDELSLHQIERNVKVPGNGHFKITL